MFCNECGASLPAGSKFCPKCGKAVADAGKSAGVTADSDAGEAKAEATNEAEESAASRQAQYAASATGARASAAGSGGGVVEFKNSPRETFFVGFVLVVFGICGLTDELNVFGGGVDIVLGIIMIGVFLFLYLPNLKKIRRGPIIDVNNGCLLLPAGLLFKWKDGGTKSDVMQNGIGYERIALADVTGVSSRDDVEVKSTSSGLSSLRTSRIVVTGMFGTRKLRFTNTDNADSFYSMLSSVCGLS